MNTSTNSNRVANRVAIIAALAALAVMGALMVMSIVVSNDALSRGDVNAVGAATDGPARCGLSQQAFTELPAQVQGSLTESCNRPPDVMP